jgi:glutamyl-tRNA reductase
MVASADDIVARVVERFAGRLHSEEEVAVLRQAAHTVSRTLLAGPIEYVKRADNDETLEALAEAFGVHDG